MRRPSATRLVFPLLLVVFAVPAPVAWSQTTFTVDSDRDEADQKKNNGVCNACVLRDGAGLCIEEKCTLRAAIEEANFIVAGAVEIDFAVDSIAILSNLPRIERPVTIDGLRGTSKRVLLDGSDLVEDGGLRFDGKGASGSSLKSVEVRGFIMGVRFFSADDNLVVDVYAHHNRQSGIYFLNSSGNQIGLNPAPLTRFKNEFSENNWNGIELENGSMSSLKSSWIHSNGRSGVRVFNSSVTQIGGETESIGSPPGNVFSGNVDTGIEIVSNGAICGGNTIEGNIVGLDQDGEFADPNGRGIDIDSECAEGTTIGTGTGKTGGDGQSIGANLISGNSGSGILTSGTGLAIQNNLIGTNIEGTGPVGNDVGIMLFGSGHRVRDNIVSGNREQGIDIQSFTDSMLVAENLIGLDIDDGPLGNGEHGIRIRGAFHEIFGNAIGGNDGDGVFIQLAENILVEKNSIGIPFFDSRPVPNNNGINVVSSKNNIILVNRIGGNRENGIRLSSADNNIVQGNYIGYSDEGLANFVVPNGRNGIEIQRSDGNYVGVQESGGAGAYNVIALNEGDGIFVLSGKDNTLRGNRIFGNKGIGINLDLDGSISTTDLQNANDEGDFDNGANHLQNTPELQGIEVGNQEITLTYLVDSNPDSVAYPIRVDFFKADDDNEEGETPIGTDTYTELHYMNCGEAPCDTTITFVPSVVLAPSDRILATATDDDGNTSEFSFVAMIVNSTGDLGDADADDDACDTGFEIERNGEGEVECTLRAAIEEANRKPDRDKIKFDIPTSDGNYDADATVYSIRPRSPLPVVKNPVTLDATTQPEYSEVDRLDPSLGSTFGKGRPVIELNGSQAGDATGLVLDGGSSKVLGFAINQFSRQGISLPPPGGNTIQKNYIGTNAKGFRVGIGNGRFGIFVSSDDNTIGGTRPELGHLVDGNLVSDNGEDGIRIEGATDNNRVLGNLVGSDASGLDEGGNGAGITVLGGSEVLIGESSSTGNIIVGNAQEGIFIEEGHNYFIRNNYIGIVPFRSGLLKSNGGTGIRLISVDTATIGGVRRSGVADPLSGNDGEIVESYHNDIFGGNNRSIRIQGGMDITIQTNMINGVQSDDESLISDSAAILVSGGAEDTIIGGVSGEGNLIRGGVAVQGSGTRGVTVIGNLLSVNHLEKEDLHQPFDINEDGPSCFDWAGTQGQPNEGVAPPRILELTTGRVAGEAPFPNATVQIYEVDPIGEGVARYFGRSVVPLAQVVADADGMFAVDLELTAGDLITASATDEDGNTSELSQLKRPVIIVPGVGGTWIRSGGTDLWLPEGVSYQSQNDNLAG
ncbi:MAG: right-handed parallel beta-helix repeat-containing protein, partial [Rhodothermales bacterium]